MRLITILFVVLLGAGCIIKQPDQSQPLDGINTSTTITRSMCEKAGGHWNPCGSACRGEPKGTVCIDVCVPYCECGGIAGFTCPEGYVCTDYLPEGAADAMGVCKKVPQ